MRRISLEDVKEGMVLAKEAESPNREILFPIGHFLKHEDLKILAGKDVLGLWVKDSEDLNAYEQLSEAQRKNVDNMLAAVFRFNKESRHPLIHYMYAHRKEELSRELKLRAKL